DLHVTSSFGAAIATRESRRHAAAGRRGTPPPGSLRPPRGHRMSWSGNTRWWLVPPLAPRSAEPWPGASPRGHGSSIEPPRGPRDRSAPPVFLPGTPFSAGFADAQREGETDVTQRRPGRRPGRVASSLALGGFGGA